MPHTDTSEEGQEKLTVESLINEAEYVQGKNSRFDLDHGVDL